ncbi:metallophosphoesterase, partial [Streptomyces bambusae]|nr:metallophosphoesterase [Streptomyces bambusae]
MTVVLVVAVVLLVLALLVLVHRWLWIRLVRDTTTSGSRVRRVLTAAAFALPALSLAALTGHRAGLPFGIEQLVAWPGFLWLPVLLYLTLAMLVGEAVRAVWLRRERSTAAAASPAATAATAAPVPAARAGG